MDVSYMREMISKVYEGPNWKERCKWMADAQVMAIFFNMRDRGMFDRPRVKKQIAKPEEVQISIWDIMKGEDKDETKDVPPSVY